MENERGEYVQRADLCNLEGVRLALGLETFDFFLNGIDEVPSLLFHLGYAEVVHGTAHERDCNQSGQKGEISDDFSI